MKRIFTSLFCVLVSLSSFAQTQQGIVKTRGRNVNGQLVPGCRLTGATITLSFGNPLVSGNQGKFSFNVPAGKSFSLVSVEKKGYTLADAEYTRRSFMYSADNPFYVVLEDESQRQADINAATRKVRKTLIAQLEKREEEIESLKAQNKLTEKEYQERLKQLYENQTKSEQLVREIAERYASTDYDQMDEFHRQVQMYIEEGELQKADSLISSKGDIEQQVAKYHEVIAENNAEREKLEQREKGAAMTYEDLSQNLLNRSEIFLQKFQQDSALHCLKLRAELDTTNVKKVKDYADLCYTQKKYKESELYYLMCLRAYSKRGDLLNMAVIRNSLGNLHSFINDYDGSEMYYTLSLQCLEEFSQQDPDAYRVFLAAAQNNLGNFYSSKQDYVNSEKYYKLALENREKLFVQNPEAYRGILGETQNNLGVLYYRLSDFENSEKYYKLALENKEYLFKVNPESTQASLASTQNNLGVLYRTLHNYESSIKFHELALENRLQLFNKNPDAFRPDLAKTQNHLGLLYLSMKDFERSKQYIISSLENYEHLFKQSPEVYRSQIANSQNNLGILYHRLSDYENAEKYYKLALENKEVMFLNAPDAYRADIASLQHNLGKFYAKIHDYANSETYFKHALANGEELLKINPKIYRQKLAEIQKSLAMLYSYTNDYTYSINYYHLALENYELLFKQNHDEYHSIVAELYYYLSLAYMADNEWKKALNNIDNAIALVPDDVAYYDTKGEILLKLRRGRKALKIWKTVLKLDPNFKDKYPEGTNLPNGLREFGLLK